MAELPVGSLFGRYEIERELGRGGFGVVYLATDTNPHLTRRVALKVLDAALGSQETFRERFFRESRLASALDHPNIVAIHDAGEHDGQLYIAMRFVDGTDLRTAIASRNLDPRQTVTVLTHVAAGLDAAHAAGVVHRDVKPANILLSTNPLRAYLADFGLTKQLASESSAVSSVGQFLGTFAYAAPEQLQGLEVDGRTDQYALGCTLYECLTGRIPFDGPPEAVFAAHLTKPPPPVTGPCPWLPSAIDAVVARAMAKSPNDRYPNCGTLAAAAEVALLPDGPSVPGDAGGWGGETSAPGSRERAITPAGDIAATPSLSGDETVAPVGWTPPVLQPRPSPPSPPAPPSGSPPAPGSMARRRWPMFAGAAAVLVVVGAFLLVGGQKGTSNRGFPNANERALLAKIPSSLRESCVREALAIQDQTSRAAVHCDPGRILDAVTFESFPSAAALDAVYDGELAGHGIAKNTDEDCINQSGKDEHAYVTETNLAGQVTCFVDAGNDYVVWTVASEHILGRASRSHDDDRGLYLWWSDLVRRHFADFPTEAEQALLAHVPKAFRSSCRRDQDGGALALVRCHPSYGVDEAYYAQFKDGAAMAHFYDVVVNFVHVPRDTGGGAACPREGVRRLEGVDNGRNVCGPFGHGRGAGIMLGWTDDNLNIYGEVDRNDQDYAKLESFWENDAAPLP